VRLSPVTRRRLAIFRQHRRGYISFWIFLAVFGASLFAEFIANDRPLLISFNGALYFPVLQDYSEEVALARIYAGFHYRFSADVGKEMGKKIGEQVIATLLRRQ